MWPVNKTVKDVIRGSFIQKSSIMLCLWYMTTYADLCKSALLPHLYIFFPICVALVLLPLCHRCMSCGTRQHRIVHHETEQELQLKTQPWNKTCHASWSECNRNHNFFETSVEPKLGIETSKYSACPFWTTACQLDVIQCWNSLHPVKRSPGDLVSYSSSSLPSSLFLVVYHQRMWNKLCPLLLHDNAGWCRPANSFTVWIRGG